MIRTALAMLAAVALSAAHAHAGQSTATPPALSAGDEKAVRAIANARSGCGVAAAARLTRRRLLPCGQAPARPRPVAP